MDNARFQEMVLEHLAHISQEITEIKLDVSGLKSDVSGLKTDVADLKTDVADLKTGQEIIKVQVAELVEFRIEAKQKLDQLVDDVSYLKYKESQNEEDLYKLKKHLQIIK